MSLLDLLVVGIVILSALLASVRGFTREVLAIVAWVAAAAISLWYHSVALNFIAPHIGNKQIALAVAIAVVFLIVLVAVTLITVRFSDMILDSRIGALDRSLGFLFGVARGILIAVIPFMIFDKLVGEKQYPDWVNNARVRPLLKEGGELVAKFVSVPEWIDRIKERPKDSGEAAPATRNAPAAPVAAGATPPKAP